jgi:DNA polymerase III alpha subunit
MMSRREFMRSMAVAVPAAAVPRWVFGGGFKREVRERLTRRIGVAGEEYRARLERELGVISRRAWGPRFEAAAVAARTARDCGVLIGPGRGDLPSSLVAFALGITAIDPIRYGLLFEPFAPEQGDPTLWIDVEGTAPLGWIDAMARRWPGPFEMEARIIEGELLLAIEPGIRLSSLPVLGSLGPCVRSGELALESIDLDEAARGIVRDLHPCTFGFEEAEVRRLLVKLQPERFEDLVAAVAMCRPGPLEWIDEVVARWRGRMPDPAHPAMEPILRDTWGVVLYHEQVVRLVAALGGFSLAEAERMRRAMAGHPAKTRVPFVQGCVRQGIDTRTAAEVFDQMAPFASYACARSHAVARVLLTLWDAEARRRLGSRYERATQAVET